MKWLLCIPILLSLYFASIGHDWDQGTQQHPDERFLSQTLSRMDFSGGYFDTANSRLNPNNVGSSFYVYGNLPINLVRVLHEIFPATPYYLLQRYLSLVSYVGCVCLVIAICLQVSRAGAAFVGGLLTASSVGLIQNAHFGTVDLPGIFCVTSALCFAVRGTHERSSSGMVQAVGVGLFSGLAAACKINFGIVILAIFFSSHANKYRGIVLAVCAALLSFRILQPYAFVGFFNLNPAWIEQLRWQAELAKPNVLYPPSIQWFDISPWHGIYNMAFYGMGLGGFSLCAIGFLVALRQRRHMGVLFCGAGFLLVAFTAPNSYLRYALPAYPMLYTLAGVSACAAMRKGSLGVIFVSLCVTMSIAWAVRFTGIYAKEHTRVSAAKWVAENLADEPAIRETQWDDPLPGIRFTHEIDFRCFDQRPNFEELGQARYFISTSRRCSGTVGRLPELFPLQSKFYDDLLRERTPFKLIKQFDAGLNDESADESFSVYDHPTVMIFENRYYGGQCREI